MCHLHVEYGCEASEVDPRPKGKCTHGAYPVSVGPTPAASIELAMASLA